MSVETKLEKVGLFFVKTINSYRAYSVKDNPLLEGIHLNKNVEIKNDTFYGIENILSDDSFFKLLENIQSIENSSLFMNHHILKLISHKLSEITMDSFYNKSIKTRKDFLDKFSETQINQIKELLYYFQKNDHLLVEYKKQILKCTSNIYNFFSKKDINDPEFFPEYNDIAFSLLKDDDDFKYTINFEKRIYLGLPITYMRDFFLSRNQENQKKYQKYLLKSSHSFMSMLPFYFKIEKENLPLLYKFMAKTNKNNIKNTSKRDRISFDFSSSFIKMEAFSQPEFIIKLLSSNKTIDTFFKFRDVQKNKNMTPDVGIFDSIFQSFLNRPELLNKNEEKDFIHILSIIKRYINNDEDKFNNVFFNVFSTNLSDEKPFYFDKINQLLHIISDFEPSLLKKIFSKESVLNQNNSYSYLSLYNKTHIYYSSIWKNCNWPLYKYALETNFFYSLDDLSTKRISEQLNIYNIYPFVKPHELKEAISFISNLNSSESSKMCAELFDEFKYQHTMLYNKKAILSYFSWENELEKLSIILSNISKEHLNYNFGKNCITYYSLLLEKNEEFTNEPLKKFFMNHIVKNISETKSLKNIINNDFFFSFTSLLDPKNIQGDVENVKQMLLNIDKPEIILKEKNFWNDTKWNESNIEFKNILFISIEKELLTNNVEKEQKLNTSYKKRRI